MSYNHTENEEKLREFAKGIKFNLPTKEEIDEVYRTFLNHECLADHIKHAKGLNDDDAWKFATKVIESEKTDNPIDWTEPDIDYGLDGGFSKERYRIVERISNNLPKSELLEAAKAGIYSLESPILYLFYPLTFMRLNRINDLVREAYYAYYKNTGRMKLEKEQERLIELFESLLKETNKLLDDNKEEYDKNECIEYFNSSNKNVNVGIIKETAKGGIHIYSPESFNILYRSGLITNDSSRYICDPKRLIGEKELITKEIEKLNGMYYDSYRRYKIGLMNLTQKEQKRYDKSIKKYEKIYHK